MRAIETEEEKNHQKMFIIISTDFRIGFVQKKTLFRTHTSTGGRSQNSRKKHAHKIEEKELSIAF